MDITSWPGGEQKKSILSFVGGEVELSGTGLSFGWFEWRCAESFLKASAAKTTVFEVKCVVWSVDWNLSGPETNP